MWKFSCRYKRSGVVLVAALWVMVILGMFVVVVSRGTRLEVAYAGYTMGQNRIDGYILSGVALVFDEMTQNFSGNAEGSKLMHPRLQQKDEPAPEHWIDTGYCRFGRPGQESYAAAAGLLQGVDDEASRINLNTLTPANFTILQHLLILLDVDHAQALSIARAVLDWKDADNDCFQQIPEVEETYYLSQLKAIRVKNRPFDSLEEILLLRDMTPEIYKKAAPFLTVYPGLGEMRINFNTAPLLVLKALARSASGALTNTDYQDADSLADKIFEKQPKDEDAPDLNRSGLLEDNLVLNAKERAIFFGIAPLRQVVPELVRFQVQGFDPLTRMDKTVEIVADWNKHDIIFWQRVP